MGGGGGRWRGERGKKTTYFKLYTLQSPILEFIKEFKDVIWSMFSEKWATLNSQIQGCLFLEHFIQCLFVKKWATLNL